MRLRRLAICSLAVCLSVAAATVGCGSSYEPELPPRDSLVYPIGLELHPDGRYLYVVNSNFNARYRPEAGGTVSVLDTRRQKLLPERTPYIPSFGGGIELNDDASRAYVTSRNDNALVALEVGSADATGRRGGSLYCTDDEGNPTSNPERCVYRRVPKSDGSRLADDPFDLSVTTIESSPPDRGESTDVDVVSLSYLASDRVSTASFPGGDDSAASLQSAGLVSGSNAIARRPGTLNYYAAGRNSNVVARFTPYVNLRDEGNFGEVEALFRLGELTVSNFVDQQDNRISINARGLAFGPEGEFLYIATRRPDALHVVRLADADPASGSGVDHEFVASIPVGDDPSGMTVHEGADDRTRIYVNCYGDQSIQVVNPASRTVTDEIELDASPYELVIEGEGSDDRCESSGDRCRAYVSLFDDTDLRSERCDSDSRTCGSIGVLQLDPASPRYHDLITKIQ